ncbi:MAG: hypothetical protein ACYCS4_12935 [Acidimicrobiales bacterium]
MARITDPYSAFGLYVATHADGLDGAPEEVQARVREFSEHMAPHAAKLAVLTDLVIPAALDAATKSEVLRFARLACATKQRFVTDDEGELFAAAMTWALEHDVHHDVEREHALNAVARIHDVSTLPSGETLVSFQIWMDCDEATVIMISGTEWEALYRPTTFALSMLPSSEDAPTAQRLRL